MTDKDWMSVKYELPEYETEVLWYFENEKYLIAEIYEDEDNAHILGGYNSDTNIVYSPATHWMPLPKPPQK